MPISGRTGFEREFRDVMGPLVKRMNALEDEIHQSLIAGIKGAKRSAGYWDKLNKQLKALYVRMNKVFDDWAEDAMPTIYKNALRKMDDRIKNLGALAGRARQDIVALINSRATSQLAATLYSDAADTFLASSLSGQRNVLRFTRLTQQALIQERVLDLAVAEGIELGNLRKAISTISGRMSSELFNMIDEKQFVQAGARKYRPSDYAELVARTKFHEAQSAAALAQAQNYGTDLVQISTHNTTTAICIEYEGKVFSISGDDKRFPQLDNTPPFHPNCLHLAFPTFESAMRQQGTLDSFSAFSKGQISRPPVPSGFVPVSERSVS